MRAEAVLIAFCSVPGSSKRRAVQVGILRAELRVMGVDPTQPPWSAPADAAKEPEKIYAVEVTGVFSII